MQFVASAVVERFDISIRLERLLCLKGRDASGRSEPYIWPAFVRADASTFTGRCGEKVQFTVPVREETGRGVFGVDGHSVSAGDTLTIPRALGEYRTTLETLDALGPEASTTGFVLALFEEGGTPADAVRAGHEEFASALQDEVNHFLQTHLRHADDSETAGIKETVRARVLHTVKDRLSWYQHLRPQDDFLGFLGGSDTLFTTSELRSMAGTGLRRFRTPIRGTERALRRARRFGPHTWGDVEHRYDLFWSLEVNAQPLEVAVADAHRSSSWGVRDYAPAPGWADGVRSAAHQGRLAR